MRTRLYFSPDLFASHALDSQPDPGEFRMHTHALGELFCFLQGHAVFHIEGATYPLEPGDIVLMRPAEAHYIEVSADAPYERYVINFTMDFFNSIDPESTLLQPYYDREAGTKNLYRAKDFGDNRYMEHFRDLHAHKNNRLATMADLVLLLTHINEIFCSKPSDGSDVDTVEQRMLRHINNNLCTPLSLEYLCDRYFISRAQLCRRFKKATGTSVGKYITAKRLIFARQQIQKGHKPTEVFSQCGFQDYSTFYRAYSKYFGYSPKEESPDRILSDPEEYKIMIG